MAAHQNHGVYEPDPDATIGDVAKLIARGYEHYDDPDDRLGTRRAIAALAATIVVQALGDAGVPPVKAMRIVDEVQELLQQTEPEGDQQPRRSMPQTAPDGSDTASGWIGAFLAALLAHTTLSEQRQAQIQDVIVGALLEAGTAEAALASINALHDQYVLHGSD